MQQGIVKNTKEAVVSLLHALIDQSKARVIVPPYEPKSGYWFGGGNLVQDQEGNLWLSGRYRNYGDSRTGVAAGTRGLECAIFRSSDSGQTFSKVQKFTKADLSRPDAKVLSIEGTALHQRQDGTWELFVSTEKEWSYPDGYEQFQKPGTGVWSIDRLTAPTLGSFSTDSLEPVVANKDDPGYLHVKDPVIFDNVASETVLMFCAHPMSWASSNTGYAIRATDQDHFDLKSWQIVERGPIWDIAVTRITNCMMLPAVGQLADTPYRAVYFYDGAESMRQLDENPRANSRPRGYSCEEIGGALLGSVEDMTQMERLSYTSPLFVSPYGTGSSRYVSTLVTDDTIYAIWEQSQPDGSQPLVMNSLSMDEVKELLG